MIYILKFYAAQAASVGLVFLVVCGSLYFEQIRNKNQSTDDTN